MEISRDIDQSRKAEAEGQLPQTGQRWEESPCMSEAENIYVFPEDLRQRAFPDFQPSHRLKVFAYWGFPDV